MVGIAVLTVMNGIQSVCWVFFRHFLKINRPRGYGESYFFLVLSLMVSNIDILILVFKFICQISSYYLSFYILGNFNCFKE